jgi:FkbM family methyltransferase
MAKYRSSNFSLQHRLVSALSKHAQNLVYTSRQGLTKGMKRKGGLGFVPEGLFGHPAGEEIRFLRSLDFTGRVVYDLGGYQGLMTIFFAQAATRVITYEANPSNVVRILENAELNGQKNVFVRGAAVGSHDGILTLHFDPSMSGAASGDPEIVDQMLRTGSGIRECSVALTTVDADRSRLQLPPPDFIKIDIEGMELNALEGMEGTLSACSPDLYIELHGTTPEDKRANACAVISFLTSRGYSVYAVEFKREITCETPTGRESHIYCTHPGRRGLQDVLPRAGLAI